jgi:phosphoglycolate phosphatase-like HAD superfamily hydrolase
MQHLVTAAECVLLDFDGPICDLFRNHPARDIAARLRSLVAEREGAHAVTAAMRETDDPQAVLHAVTPGSPLAAFLERALTEEEVTASATAMPTPFADPLVRTLLGTGRRVAVTTNNSREAVERYLASRGLDRPLAGHVHGRPADLRLLKPDPHCLRRALESTGTDAARALMIGDTVVDLKAAAAARVPFLGYAPRPARRAELTAAGAATVSSLEEVLRLVNTPSFG